jgi:hypothetical protein
MHRRVEAFYAPRTGEGNQILPINVFASVETIRGYTTMIFSPSLAAPARRLLGHCACSINTCQGRLGPQMPSAIQRLAYRHIR